MQRSYSNHTNSCNENVHESTCPSDSRTHIDLQQQTWSGGDNLEMVAPCRELELLVDSSPGCKLQPGFRFECVFQLQLVSGRHIQI